MSQNLTISETGLKLIKAFEGYRPVDRELISGQRIVGYGHRLYSEDAVIMDKIEAEETLMADLAPFEDMINTEVHAPLSQSQFDALCSFAFNIGPKAFLQSDTLRAINNGRPLDAANGLDIWRKSEIEDYQDNEITPEIEDGPLEPLDLGLDLDLDLDLDLREEYSEPDTDTVSEPESRKSPIAAAATDIVARLDALIEDADARFEDSETDGDWANNLIEADENETLQEVIESSAVDENQVDENQVPKTCMWPVIRRCLRAKTLSLSLMS